MGRNVRLYCCQCEVAANITEYYQMALYDLHIADTREQKILQNVSLTSLTFVIQNMTKQWSNIPKNLRQWIQPYVNKNPSKELTDALYNCIIVTHWVANGY